MKKFIAGFLIGSVLFGAAGALATDLEIKVSSLPLKFLVGGIDKTPPNNQFNSSPSSFIYNGNVYIPIGLASSLSEKLFTYDSQKSTVIVGSYPIQKFLSDDSPFYINSDSKKSTVNLNQMVKMGGQEYTKNIKILTVRNGISNYTYNINGIYKSFEAIIGLTDEYNKVDVSVKIIGDDKPLWSGILKSGNLPQNINIDVTGVSKLDFQFENFTNEYTNPVVANPVIK